MSESDAHILTHIPHTYDIVLVSGLPNLPFLSCCVTLIACHLHPHLMGTSSTHHPRTAAATSYTNSIASSTRHRPANRIVRAAPPPAIQSQSPTSCLTTARLRMIKPQITDIQLGSKSSNFKPRHTELLATLVKSKIETTS